jgi:hypothetical protein
VSTPTRRFASMAAVVPLGLVIALGVRPIPVARILAAYALALAALVLLALTRATNASEAYPAESVFEQWLKPASPVNVRPPEVVRIEREISLGSASAGHLHRRLLPLLREAARTRLTARHHVDLERRPDEARKLLGEEAWELLRPDRPAPLDPSDVGLPLRTIGALVGTLEQL